VAEQPLRSYPDWSALRYSKQHVVRNRLGMAGSGSTAPQRKRAGANDGVKETTHDIRSRRRI